MHNTTNPTGSLIPRLDVAGGTLAGALTALIIAAAQWGDWSAVDWTTVGAAFTVVIQQGAAYLFPTVAKEAVSAFAGGVALIAVALIQWAVLGTPFDVAAYASAITAVVTFIVNVVVPRLQPVV
jgi:hypothetical protein